MLKRLPGAPPTSVPRVTVNILLYEIGFQYIYVYDTFTDVTKLVESFGIFDNNIYLFNKLIY